MHGNSNIELKHKTPDYEFVSLKHVEDKLIGIN
jgi:hypothetical protein